MSAALITGSSTGIGYATALRLVDCYGAMQCIKAVIPSLRERGGGWIVDVTSQARGVASPAMAPWCRSKLALEAASESLSIELAP